MRVAGHAALVHSLFESTPAYFRSYLTQESPEFSIMVTREDLLFEQQDALDEALAEGFRPRNFPDPYLERAAVQRQFAQYLFDRDTLLLHGSTIAVDGSGYLFTARSGTGKSTHTRLWRELLGSRAVMVNDDKPFLRISGSAVWAYGSPWSGKHGLDTNICVPLRGICLLERGQENRIRPAQAAELLPILQKQAYCPADPSRLPKFRQLVDMLAQSVPLWYLECNREPSAAMLSYQAMSAPTPMKCTAFI